MALYEHVFLARQDLSQAQVDQLAATATEIVEKNEGKVTKTETWGLKNLAYKIDRNRKAHFVMLNIEGPGAVVQELERQTRINEDVIRYMTIRVEEHEEGPSVMMRKSVARSSPAASPPSARRSSVNWPRPSSALATSACCRTS
jgi:small subunit ribosomal protein S6